MSMLCLIMLCIVWNHRPASFLFLNLTRLLHYCIVLNASFKLQYLIMKCNQMESVHTYITSHVTKDLPYYSNLVSSSGDTVLSFLNDSSFYLSVEQSMERRFTLYSSNITQYWPNRNEIIILINRVEIQSKLK